MIPFIIDLTKYKTAQEITEDMSAIFKRFGKKTSTTREIQNLIVTFKKSFPADESKVIPADFKERKYLLKEIDKAVKEIKKDPETRKAIIYNLFSDTTLKHNCLSTLHLMLRNGKLSMNVYVRSQNYESNFFFDMNTFDQVLTKAAEKLDVKKGVINSFIGSLHIYN